MLIKMQTCKIITLFFLACLLTGCVLKKKTDVEPLDLTRLVSDPLSPEETQGVLKEVGTNWAFGQGVGDTAVTVGSILLFPPYGLFVLGNAILDISGYEPVRMSDALPEPEREAWTAFYQEVTSGPGRLNAAVAGKEFRTQESARQRLSERLNRSSDEPMTQMKPQFVESSFPAEDELNLKEFWSYID